ncbi:MAG: hypothetical protein ACRD0G_15415 [Acidimicrobiales bacterium]
MAAFGLLTAACGDRDPEASRSDAPAGDEGDAMAVEQIAGGPREDVPSALEDPTNPAFPAPVVDVEGIRSGGPPPDGIPAPVPTP